jgi:protoporphyrinogen IX oxidase
MLWVKSFHIIFVISWFAGIFYLPRLFVYHAMTDDQTGRDRFKIMERKLYGLMNLAAVLSLASGLWLWLGYGITGGWLYAKLALVVLLLGYHHACGRINKRFARDENTRNHVFYRWFNEVPTVLLIATIILVVVKPF